MAHPTLYYVSIGLTVAILGLICYEDIRFGSFPLWQILVFWGICGLYVFSTGMPVKAAIISPLCTLGLFGLVFVLFRGKLGLGDVLLATGLAVFVRWWDLPYALLAASMGGLLLALVQHIIAFKNNGTIKNIKYPFSCPLLIGFLSAFLFSSTSLSSKGEANASGMIRHREVSKIFK